MLPKSEPLFYISKGVDRINSILAPEWEAMIDLDYLDMGDTCNCVLGQLNRNGLLGSPLASGEDDYYAKGSAALGVNPYGAEAEAMGFIDDYGNLVTEEMLNEAWSTYLEARQLALHG